MGRTAVDRFSLRFLWNYAEENDVRTARNTFGSLKYDYMLSKDFYGYVAADFLSDEFRDLDLRATGGGGGGYLALDQKDMTLRGELGVSVLSENFKVAKDDQRLTGRLAAKFSWTISETIKLSEHITAFPSLEDSQVQIRNEFGVTNAIGHGWSLSFSNVLDHNSDPPPGIRKTDVLWLVSLQYTFG